MITSTLSREQIAQKAPAVLSTDFKSTLTSRYTHIPTSVLLEDMAKLGWEVVDVKQQYSRKTQSIAHKKHLVVFRNPNLMIKGKDGDDVYPQILIVNSHDGSSSFQFRAGIFRLICSNGLVVCTENFGKTCLRHSGYTFTHLQHIVNQLTTSIPNTIDLLNRFTNTTMTTEMMEEFVTKAIEIRFNDGKVHSVSVGDILTPTRNEDAGNSLWKVFNRVQERLVQGNFVYNNGDPRKQRKARSIKNLKRDIEFNEKLFFIASMYAN
jgi:hypothetical protein